MVTTLRINPRTSHPISHPTSPLISPPTRDISRGFNHQVDRATTTNISTDNSIPLLEVTLRPRGGGPIGAEVVEVDLQGPPRQLPTSNAKRIFRT